MILLQSEITLLWRWFVGIESGTYGQGEGRHGVLLGELHGCRVIGRLRRRWKDTIKNGSSINRRGVDWIDAAEGTDRWLALLNMVKKGPIFIKHRDFLLASPDGLFPMKELSFLTNLYH